MMTALLLLALAGWECRDLPGGRYHQVLEEEMPADSLGMGLALGCMDPADQLLTGICSPVGLIDQRYVLRSPAVEALHCDYLPPRPPAEPCGCSSPRSSASTGRTADEGDLLPGGTNRAPDVSAEDRETGTRTAAAYGLVCPPGQALMVGGPRAEDLFCGVPERADPAIHVRAETICSGRCR